MPIYSQPVLRDARRHPGSTFKPFVLRRSSSKYGMSLVQTFMDAPQEFVYDRYKI